MLPESFSAIFFFWAFNFFIAFIASFLGSICVDLLKPLHTNKKRRMSTVAILTKGCAYSFFVGIILSAIYEKFNWSYPALMAIAGCVGGGGDFIFEVVINKDFLRKFTSNLLKNSKDVVLKSAADALIEDSEENKSKNE